MYISGTLYCENPPSEGFQVTILFKAYLKSIMIKLPNSYQTAHVNNQTSLWATLIA